MHSAVQLLGSRSNMKDMCRAVGPESLHFQQRGRSWWNKKCKAVSEVKMWPSQKFVAVVARES